MSFVDKWVAVLKNPKQTLAAERQRASISTGLGYLALSGLITGLLYGAFIFAFGNSIGIGAGAFYGVGAFFSVVYPLLLLVCAFILNGIIYLFARILGGQGSFSQQFYLYALALAPLQIISACVTGLIFIPVVGILFWLVSLALGLAALYYQVLSIREAHQVGTGKAIAILVVPIIVLCVLIFGVLIFASVLWYTGVFNPSKFQEARGGGGFGVFTYSDHNAGNGGVEILLGNSVGRPITVQSAYLAGNGAPSSCSIDNRYGSREIAPNALIRIKCEGTRLPSNSAFDWQVGITYVDSQSGLTKTDAGGFIRGKVS